MRSNTKRPEPDEPLGYQTDRLLYQSSLLRVGTFTCPPWYPHFEDTGPTQGYLLVFPRTSVRITHSGRRPVVADPNVVMFYNRGQPYRRGKLSNRGDVSDWFAFSPRTIVEATRPHDPAVVERGQEPFTFTHGPTYSPSYLSQRLVIKHIHESARPDNLYIEETMLSVLNQVLEDTYQAYGERTKTSRPDTARVHKELVQEVKALLATRFKKQLSLQQIASKVHVSPYHLCRIFRQHTGFTIHRYLNQIRLRTSLEYVAQGDTMLAELGLELGYSSHSHFTQAFKRTFGTPPSDLQKTASSGRLREMSKILTA